MSNTQSKMREIEDTSTLTTAIELLRTRMTIEEQRRQQNDCMELIREYGLPDRLSEYGSMIQYIQLSQFTSRNIIDYDYLNYDKLALRGQTDSGEIDSVRINHLYDDIIRCVTLETKQILTYIDKQRKTMIMKDENEKRSKTFDLTNINDKLGYDVMNIIRSYMPVGALTRVYSWYLDKSELVEKISMNVPTCNRMNLKEMYDIVVEIMGKRREQEIMDLYRRITQRDGCILRHTTNQIFDPVFKNGSRTPRSRHNISKRISSLIKVARNCLGCETANELVKSKFQKMGMDFADLINYMYNNSDYKKIEYYNKKVCNIPKKHRILPIGKGDYKKIKYLYEEIGESWKVIASQYGRTSYFAIKRLYDDEKEIEFEEEYINAHKEQRAMRITGLYENRRKNKYFQYIKFGLSKPYQIRKYMMEIKK